MQEWFLFVMRGPTYIRIDLLKNKLMEKQTKGIFVTIEKFFAN